MFDYEGKGWSETSRYGDGDGIPDIEDIVDVSGNAYLQVGGYTGSDGGRVSDDGCMVYQGKL